MCMTMSFAFCEIYGSLKFFLSPKMPFRIIMQFDNDSPQLLPGRDTGGNGFEFVDDSDQILMIPIDQPAIHGH